MGNVLKAALDFGTVWVSFESLRIWVSFFFSLRLFLQPSWKLSRFYVLGQDPLSVILCVGSKPGSEKANDLSKQSDKTGILSLELGSPAKSYLLLPQA